MKITKSAKPILNAIIDWLLFRYIISEKKNAAVSATLIA
jgi:hypothetical protein